MNVKSQKLNNGVLMPEVGFGMYLVGESEMQRVLDDAIDAGYRSMDIASFYGNEAALGRAIENSGMRDELFITTKVWNDMQGYENTLRSFNESRKKLALEYVDLFLIHWPGYNRKLRIETWRACIHLLEEGDVRAIGVSNFTEDQISDLVFETGVMPATNQVERHPLLRQEALLAYHTQNDIRTVAWSPIMHGRDNMPPVVVEIAKKHGKSPQQVTLRWHLQSGVIPIPKASSKEHIKQNIDIYDFELTPEEMEAINAQDKDLHFGSRPQLMALGFENTITPQFYEDLKNGLMMG